MLKEQAISLLTQVKKIILGSESWLDSVHQPIEEAFSMAIEAIKSTQHNAPNVLNALDCISRQAAIDALDEIESEVADGYGYQYEKWRKYFCELPSAQPVDKDIDVPVKDCISRQMLLEYIHGEPVGRLLCDKYNLDGLIEQLPSAQPELIERTAYIRGFEQGRTQGMIDSQGGKNMIKAEWTNADTLDLQPTCNKLATDTISRQAAIDAVAITPKEWDGMYIQDLNCRLRNVLSSLPSAQPERKRGKWIIKAINTFELAYGSTGYEPVYECSECGGIEESYLRLDEPIMPEDADFPEYCPNCGAKMEG